MAGKDKIQGEGDYEAARRFRKAEEDFVRDKDKVETKAHEAEEALDGPEGEELERARQETKSGRPH